MDDVTDVAFRDVISEIGKPDVLFTEFTNCEALFSKGRSAQIQRLSFTSNQKPIVAQIWGVNPENFYNSAKLASKLHFDGIDINMGCPHRTVVKNGACSALINNHSKAREIIDATIRGAGNLPVSVKTRLGFNSFQPEWFEFLFKFNLAVVTVHARTVKEKSEVLAKWEFIKEIVNIKNQINQKILVIGNGDIESLKQGKAYSKEFGTDGIMIGRGIFKNPWVFSKYPDREYPKEVRLELLLKHARIFDKTWGSGKNFAIMKKFFKIYINGFEGAGSLRNLFMQTGSVADVERLVSAATLLRNNLRLNQLPLQPTL